ncbi:MAG: nucleoside transporter C-terminal domain-containing protein [Gammaproteobacteria bacterium]
MWEHLHSALGLAALTAMAWAISENRRAVKVKIALAGVALQIAVALVLLKVPPVTQLFSALNSMVLVLQEATEAGASFVFGYLGGGPLPFEVSQPGASFILAFRALPLVIVVSALTAVLTYWRILPLIVRGFSALLERSMGVGGAVGLGAAANIFVGMVEAPLFIRPYLRTITRSELFVIMCVGMATIAGTVLILYANILGDTIPNAVGHLLIASLISAPAAITIAKLMVPETGVPTSVDQGIPSNAGSTMDAVTKGTQSGLMLLLNIMAMLVVLVALVHLVNTVLALIPDVAGAPITLQRLLGFAMAPVTWLMGVPWHEASTAGALMGTKTVLNEFLAFLQLTELPAEALSPRSQLIMTYALCGFANFGSLGILIGGLSTMVPERQQEIVALGPKSIVAGTLATCCTGAVVGML